MMCSRLSVNTNMKTPHIGKIIKFTRSPAIIIRQTKSLQTRAELYANKFSFYTRHRRRFSSEIRACLTRGSQKFNNASSTDLFCLFSENDDSNVIH